jgi:cysteine desulfurase
MKLSTKSRYALRALANLIDQGCCCSISKIAKNEHLSSDYLEKIFAKLKKAGVLTVERGASGGYILSRNPKDITLKEVIDALEKPEFSCPDVCNCHSKNLYQQIQSGFNQVLNSITLGSIDDSGKTVYLDYAASTPVDPQVVSTLISYLNPKYSGNSSSLHQFGINAAQVIEDSRAIFANILNAKVEEIIFTSSATESNNTVLKGVAWANSKKGKHIIISSIEHDCVRNSAQWLKTQGFEITQVPVDKDGFIDLKFLEKSIRSDTILVSIIHGNNEIGTIQNIGKIGKICHKYGVYFHTDASQSFSKVPIDVQKDNIDFLTISSQKIYGPKGVALLYVKSGSKITPLLHGGGHEFELRSSTVNTPLIAAFTKAAQIAIDSMDLENKRLTELRDYLIKNILKNIPNTHLNGPVKNRLCNNINISFDKIEGESILLDLDMHGIICSTGSACSSHSLEPSHVLLALGLKPEQAHSSIRFSLGRFTTKSNLDYLLKILPQTIQKMRQLSPFK